MNNRGVSIAKIDRTHNKSDIVYLEDWIDHLKIRINKTKYKKAKNEKAKKKKIDNLTKYLQSLNKDLETLQNEIDANRENDIKKVAQKLRELVLERMKEDKIIKSKYLSCLMENGNVI
jgi:ATP-dependent Clp protease ATP-binding subunit ClpA